MTSIEEIRKKIIDDTFLIQKDASEYLAVMSEILEAVNAPDILFYRIVDTINVLQTHRDSLAVNKAKLSLLNRLYGGD